MTNVLQSISNEMAELVETVGASVVRVNARKRQAASGVVWSTDGVIVTANHVVRRDEKISVGLPNGNGIAAELIGRDPSTDLAVLRADANDLTAASWIDSGDVSVGNLALALGRPGRTVQATLGVASGLGSNWRTGAGGEIERYFQTDVTMYPGFSGGPLAMAGGKDGNGQVTGINSSALVRGVSITIPSETVRRVVDTLLNHGRVPRGYLGVGIQPVRLPDAVKDELGQEAGLIILSVETDGPAAKSEILQGDILVSLDEKPVRYADELQQLLTGDRVGKEVVAQIVRSGRIDEMKVTIESK